MTQNVLFPIANILGTMIYAQREGEGFNILLGSGIDNTTVDKLFAMSSEALPPKFVMTAILDLLPYLDVIYEDMQTMETQAQQISADQSNDDTV